MLITNSVVYLGLKTPLAGGNLCSMLHALAGGDGAVVPDQFIQNLLTPLLHVGLPDLNIGLCLYQDYCKSDFLR